MLLFCTYLRTVDYDFKDRLLILTGFGYWIGTDTFFEWYSPAILMLYLIFPFLYRLIDQNNKQEEYQQKNILGFAALLMLFVGGDNQHLRFILPASVSLLAGCSHSNIYVGDICRS